MIDFLLITILKYALVQTLREESQGTDSGSRFRDTLCNNLLETLLMARVTAVFTLISSCVEQELAAKGAE
jgi:hypothetical protein